jgi:hypothetical protein
LDHLRRSHLQLLLWCLLSVFVHAPRVGFLVPNNSPMVLFGMTVFGLVTSAVLVNLILSLKP